MLLPPCLMHNTLNWVIPENIHTIPRAASWNSEGEGGFLEWNSEGVGGNAVWSSKGRRKLRLKSLSGLVNFPSLWIKHERTTEAGSRSKRPYTRVGIRRARRGWVFWNFRGQGGVKMLMPPVVGYGYFLESPIYKKNLAELPKALTQFTTKICDFLPICDLTLKIVPCFRPALVSLFRMMLMALWMTYIAGLNDYYEFKEEASSKKHTWFKPRVQI